MSSNESEGNFVATSSITANFAVRVEKEPRCEGSESRGRRIDRCSNNLCGVGVSVKRRQSDMALD